MKLSIGDKETINLIFEFIKNNFKKSNKGSINLQNFKKLIKFINENDITELSFDICDLLINMSILLKDTIINISENQELDEIFSNMENNTIKEFYNNLKLCIRTNDFEEIDNFSINDPIREYLKQIGQIPMLSEEEKKTLPPLIKQGDEKAINRYVEANLRLVVDVVKKIRKDKQNITFIDLIQEGNIGLINAVKNYDYEKGYTFSTYAYKCIQNTIYRYINKEYFSLKIGINTTRNLLRLKNIAKYLNITLDINNKDGIKILAKEAGFKLSYIEKLIKIENINMKSIYESILKDDNSTLIVDMIPAEETDFETNTFLKDFIKDFDNSSLTDRHKEILKLRSGYYGREYTRKEIGQLLHLTGERIRQIEAKALIRAHNDKKINNYSKW